MLMSRTADEGSKRMQKYLAENATPEAQNLSKEIDDKQKSETKPEQKKNDDFNEYDYGTKDEDDSNW